MKVVKGIKKYFHEKGIHLKTIQLEFVNAEVHTNYYTFILISYLLYNYNYIY